MHRLCVSFVLRYDDVMVVVLVVAAVAVVEMVVVATNKHITLSFKTRSGIKHNAERCSGVSPRFAFCFGRLFLTTHVFLIFFLFLSRNMSFLSLFFFLPFFLLFTVPRSLSLSPLSSLPCFSSRSPSSSLDTVYKPPTNTVIATNFL